MNEAELRLARVRDLRKELESWRNDHKQRELAEDLKHCERLLQLEVDNLKLGESR